jgi:outer membrane lipoprotein-sorting protein
VFDKPLDLRRHALLTVSHPQEQDEHWAYDPDKEQVKRLLSNNAATPFSGSEFNFEDLSSQDLAKYDYRFEREATLDGMPCTVVSRYPKDKNSAYERLETWIDAQTFLILKIDYYDRQGSLLKTLTASDYQLYADKYWRAKQINIKNHQSGKSTQLLWSDYEFNTGLTEKDFSLTSLRNVN